MKLIILVLELASAVFALCMQAEAGPIAMSHRAAKHARIAAVHQAKADALATGAAAMSARYSMSGSYWAVYGYGAVPVVRYGLFAPTRVIHVHHYPAVQMQSAPSSRQPLARPQVEKPPVPEQ